MTSEMSDRERALNPDTSLEDLLKLAEQFPDEFLQNPIFDILTLENPEWVSQLSGTAQLALLLSEQCPKWMLDSFEIGEVTVQAAEDYSLSSHYFDCLFEGYRIRLTGEISGKAWRLVTLPQDLIPYFLSALSAKSHINSHDSNHYRPYDFPEATAFISAAMQTHLALADDIINDCRYFLPPHLPKNATAYLLQNDSDIDTHITEVDILSKDNIYRDPKDPRWSFTSNPEKLQGLSDRFFEAHDKDELRYSDWYNEDEHDRRPWILEKIEEIKLNHKPSNSEAFVKISINELTRLNQKIGISIRQTGVLVDIYPNSHSVLSEIILDSGESAADLACELAPHSKDTRSINRQEVFSKLGESHHELEDRVVEWFTDFGIQILENSRTLNVTKPDLIEILINHPEKCEIDLFPSVDQHGSQPWNENSDPNSRYKVVSGEWYSLIQLMEDIKHNQNLRDCLLCTALYQRDESWECYLRMPSSASFIHASMGCDFSAAIGLTVGITQCLPVASDQYLCFTQGYEEGEYETGIMIPFWNGQPGHQGGYSHLHHTLEGTVWEGLGLEASSR